MEKIMKNMNNHNRKIKKRMFYPDFLRVLSITGVIMIHMPMFDITHVYNDLFISSGRFALCVFLMISGALLLNKGYSTSYFLKRRFSRIIYPLIFWTTIVLYLISNNISDNNGLGQMTDYTNAFFFMINYTNNFLIDNITAYLYIYWYMWIILGVYLSWPVINSFIKDKGMEGTKYFLCLWFFSLIIWELYIYFNRPLFFLDLSLFLGPLGFLVLGYYLHVKEFKHNSYKMTLIGLTIYILSLLVENILINHRLFNFYMFQYYIFLNQTFLKMDLFTVTQSIGIFIFIKNLNDLKLIKTFLNKEVGKYFQRFIVSLSRSTYGIYFSHFILLYIINSYFYPILPDNNYINIIYLLFMTLISSWLVVLVLGRTPFIKKFSGYY
jgi:surface polysaccharide O-acyltransferase-like enzyme